MLGGLVLFVDLSLVLVWFAAWFRCCSYGLFGLLA